MKIPPHAGDLHLGIIVGDLERINLVAFFVLHCVKLAAVILGHMAVFSSPDKQRFYVFVRCEPGRTYNVGADIAKRHLPCITEISSISGDWDLLLRVAIDKRLDLGRILAEQLIGISGIVRTKTIVAYDVRPDTT